jgi:processive 1,2-diacylglycerol beta-glucosyltransferase
MGHGHIASSLNKIDDLPLDFQTIAVCGNNKKLYNRISKIKYKKETKIFGWTDEIPLLMDAADCILTKPGGITTSEALAKGLPMIMQDPIAGHEERNAEFLQNNGLAFLITRRFKVPEAIFAMFKNHDRLLAMKNTVKLFAKPDASENIAEQLMKMV